MTSAVPSDSVQAQGSTSVKGRQQAMWASGDFAVIGTTLQIVGELLCEAVDVQAEESTLAVTISYRPLLAPALSMKRCVFAGILMSNSDCPSWGTNASR